MSKKIIKGFTPVVDSVSKPKFTTGFTLLEILLVVGIIAILAGIVIVAINPSRQLAAARDTERRSDLKQINNALLQYYIDNQSFPGSVVSDTLTEICNSGSATTFDCPDDTINLTALVPKYISAIPADPKGSTATTTGYHIALNSSHKPYLKAPYKEISETYIAIGSGTGVIIPVEDVVTFVDSCWSDETSPHPICNCDDLNSVRGQLSWNYILQNDIEMSADQCVDYNDADGFTPIGDNSTPYSGTFDGNGHIIYDLNSTMSDRTYVGLFGYLTGTVTSLGVENGDFTGLGYVGAIAGKLDGGTITKTFSEGSVSGTGDYDNYYVGGLVGTAENSATISNSYSNSIVRAGNGQGGLVGSLRNSAIINSYSLGSVYGGGDYTGGIAGSFGTPTITNSFTVTALYPSGSDGGILGEGSGSPTITNSAWYDNGVLDGDGNPRDCYLWGNNGCTRIQDANGGEGWFYDDTNAPLSSWTFNASNWDDFCNGEGFPTLSWQNLSSTSDCPN